MKKLFSVFLSLLIAYGALKLYFYYDTKKIVHQLIAEAAPFAAIQYSHFSTSPLSGSILISDIQIHLNNSPHVFYIEALSISDFELFNLNNTSAKTLNLKKISSPSIHLAPALVTPLFPMDINLRLLPDVNQKQMQVDYLQTNYDMFKLHINLIIDLPGTKAYNELRLYKGHLEYTDHAQMQQKVINSINSGLGHYIHLKPITPSNTCSKRVTIHIQPTEPLTLNKIDNLKIYESHDIAKILNLSMTSE